MHAESIALLGERRKPKAAACPGRSGTSDKLNKACVAGDPESIQCDGTRLEVCEAPQPGRGVGLEGTERPLQLVRRIAVRLVSGALIGALMGPVSCVSCVSG
jgi:hypothetical protein